MQTTRYQQQDEAIRRLFIMGTSIEHLNAIRVGKPLLYTVDVHSGEYCSAYFAVQELMNNMQTDYGEFKYATIPHKDDIGEHIYVLYVGQDTDNWKHEFINDCGVFRCEVLDIVVSKPQLSRYTAVWVECENHELKIKE